MRISPALLAALVASLAGAPVAGAQQQQQQRPVDVAPTAPADRPVTAVRECQWQAMLMAMEPYVVQARTTYPAARQRFLAGLPPHHTMFVTTRLRDARGRTEQVFVAVDSIVGPRIVGRLWSDINVVEGYRPRQRYEFADSALVDWMVARPDGSEEGNVVGKFLDSYAPPKSCEAAGAAA